MASPEIPKDLQIIQAELKGHCGGAGISYAEVQAIIKSDDPEDVIQSVLATGDRDPKGGPPLPESQKRMYRGLKNAEFTSAINQLVVLEHLWTVADPRAELERLSKEAKDDPKFDEKDPKGAYIAHLYKNPLIKQVVDKILTVQGEPAAASSSGAPKPEGHKTPDESQKLTEDKTRLQKELSEYEAAVTSLGAECPQGVKDLVEIKKGELVKVEEQIKAATAKLAETPKPAEAAKLAETKLTPEQQVLTDQVTAAPWLKQEEKNNFNAAIKGAKDSAELQRIEYSMNVLRDL